jgi:hypothetical protein
MYFADVPEEQWKRKKRRESRKSLRSKKEKMRVGSMMKASCRKIQFAITRNNIKNF